MHQKWSHKLIFGLGHRMVDKLLKDVKPLLVGKIAGVWCKKRRAMQYTVATSVRPHMIGPDLVLTWNRLGDWKQGRRGRKGGYVGTPFELARTE
jgi:hypothetical protein